MDYEVMMNGNVKIGQIAPDFEATTTMGNISLNDYKGNWVVLFSHPGDFTPVCTTEIIAFARANPYFEKINTFLIGLSIDSNSSHLAWMYDIYCKTGIIIPFPIIADRNGEIARKYGMISASVSNTETVRNVYIIDDKQKIRAILVYPMNIGRNISEILRIVKALQTADSNKQMTPANWMPCEQMIVPMPQTFETLQSRIRSIEQNRNGMSWYLSFKNPEICEIDTMPCNDRINEYNQNLSANNMEQTRKNNYMTNNFQENRNDNFNKSQTQKITSNETQNLNKITTKENEKIENRNNENKTNIKQNTNHIQTPKSQQKNNTIQWKNFR